MYTEQDLLRDPQFDQATLGHLATARPDLRPSVLAHPNCYPELADWLRAHGVQAASAPPAETPGTQQAYGRTPDTAAAGSQGAQPSAGYGQQMPYGQQGAFGQPGYPPQAGPGAAGAPQQPTQGGQSPYAQRPAPDRQPQRPGPISPDQWAAEFRQRAGREPSTAEYQAAVAAGEVGQPQRPEEPWEKASAGAHQVEPGAKDSSPQHAVPAAQGAARDFQQAANEKDATPMAKFVSLAGFVLPALALLAILPIFLPAVSVSVAGASQSVTFWDSGDGVLLLVAFLLVIAGGVVAIVMKATWARVTTAVLGMVAAVIGIVDSIAVFSGASEAAGVGLGVSADVGFGVYLLLILSLLMLVAGIVMVMPTQKKKPRSPQPYPAPGQPGAAQFGQQPAQAPYQQGHQAPAQPGHPQPQPGQSPYAQFGQPQPYPGGAPYGQQGQPPVQPQGEPAPYGQPPQNPYSRQ
ncbi:hypothetical protein [Microbacterium halotolerans]|uniref:variant leucine-rich repeat-containing protein n=1 Tax=Microbacterium halotolerans TaxID=246613 RepID=UPI000E6AA7AC|nr:hypothetical protein [Microbacterium halotolerans]